MGLDVDSVDDADDEDHFATYLADLDPDHPAVLTGDMVTQKGMLLLKKGSELKPEVAAFAVQHKLKEPLEQLVTIENGLNAESLFQQAIYVCEDFPDLEQLIDDHSFKPVLKNQIEAANLPEELFRYMTVLRDRLPTHFEKSVFCTIISMMCAEQLQLSDADKRSVLVAGLAHDIGYLHLPPELVDGDIALNATHWAKLKSHVIIGYNKLSKIPSIPESCAIAVLEHHERCDAAGYPYGKCKDQLSQIGQIIAMGDSIQAIRIDQFGDSGRNLANARPYLQLNSDTYGYELFQAIDKILSSSSIKPVSVNPYADTMEFAKVLTPRNEALAGIIPALEVINKTVPNMRPGQYGTTLLNISRSLGEMLYSSGLLQDELTQWLTQASGNSGDTSVEELDKLQLMQNELSYQLSVVRRNFVEFMNKECAKMGPSRAKLRKALEKIVECHAAVQGIEKSELEAESRLDGEEAPAEKPASEDSPTEDTSP